MPLLAGATSVAGASDELSPVSVDHPVVKCRKPTIL
jgi:hypothetical protein